MTIRKLKNLLIILLLFGVTGCKDTPEPVVLITPVDSNISAQPKEIVSFKIEVSSDKRLEKFYITAKLEGSFQHTLVDSSLITKVFNMTYQYRVPDTLTEGSLLFTFKAVDADGNLGEAARRINIYTEERILTETAGHLLYSTFSGNPDGFDINTRTPQNSMFAADSLLDIKDFDTTYSDLMLSRKWISPAGGKFVSFNGFDYANATDVSAKEAYQSGNKLDILSNISSGDIIITKVGSTNKKIYAVIRVTNVVEMDSVLNDRYEFNLKK